MFFLFVGHFVSAQNYTVVSTKGVIKVGDDMHTLARGEKIDINLPLSFANADAMAVLIGGQGQRYILQQGPASENDSELMTTIKDVLIPMKRMAALTTRGDKQHEIIDLEAMIGNQNFVFIGDTMPLLLDKAYYPMDEQRYFVYSYFVGIKAVNKKVYFENNQLIFQVSRLYSKEGELLDPSSIDEVKLFYRDDIKKDTKLITSFRPIFLSNDRLQQECNIMIAYYKSLGMSPSDIKSEINDYINTFYGKTSAEVLNVWLGKHYNF